MNLSSLFGGGGSASPFNVSILTTNTNATITTSPAYFLGYDVGNRAASGGCDIKIRTGSTTGTLMYNIRVYHYNGGLGGSLLLGGGVYCPNGIYATDIALETANPHIFYRNA